MKAASGELHVRVAEERTTFLPGETVAGTVSWRLEAAPEGLVLRLFWYTRGKGDQDMEEVDSLPIPAYEPQGRREFSFALPAGPYSFSGKLISLIWALELVAQPGDLAARQEIVVSPTGQEVLLTPVPPAT